MNTKNLFSTARASCVAAPLLAALLVVSSVPATQAAPANHGHGAAAKAPAKIYRNVRGQLITLKPTRQAGASASATVDHEAIPNFMRAMRMAMPFQSAADARKFKSGDKIRFDMVLRKGAFVIANPRLLPQGTRLKLAKMPGMAMLHSNAGGY
jgi:Cu/Ag efflux protein CusF